MDDFLRELCYSNPIYDIRDECRRRTVAVEVIMKSKFNRVRTIAAAAALSAAVSFATPAFGLVSLAATGTVTGSDINVRSEASSSSSQVGTVTTGDTVTVGETATDDSGATWYQVTLSNGTTGYIRGDFLTVSEDDASADGSSDASADGSSDASTDAATDASTDGTDEAAASATQAAEQDTGGYQVVLAPDENGEDTYYLYDNNAGQRMKISDIGKLQDDVTAANKEAASVKAKYRIFLIALGAAAVILAIACILLVLKLRDALANGRRERDLTMERRDQRRNNSRADSVESLRARDRGAGPASRNGRGREDAYASGARRLERGEDARDPREVRGARPARPAAPARDGEARGARPVRPAAPARDGEARGARPVRPAARPESDVRTDRPAARPAEDAARRPAAPARKQPAKNFADDDFDYDFLKLDDKDE